MIYIGNSYTSSGKFTIGKEYRCSPITSVDGRLVGYATIDDEDNSVIVNPLCFRENPVIPILVCEIDDLCVDFLKFVCEIQDRFPSVDCIYMSDKHWRYTVGHSKLAPLFSEIESNGAIYTKCCGIKFIRDRELSDKVHEIVVKDVNNRPAFIWKWM